MNTQYENLDSSDSCVKNVNSSVLEWQLIDHEEVINNHQDDSDEVNALLNIQL